MSKPEIRQKSGQERMSATWWKPGVSGNPGGRPKLSELEKAARELSREQIAIYWGEVSTMTLEEVRTLVKNPETNVTKLVIAKAFERALVDRLKGSEGKPGPINLNAGNMAAIQVFWDRILGKPKERIEIEDTSEMDSVRKKLDAILAAKMKKRKVKA